jgi:UDP-N-acetylglucosamine--N-acetylmuramyl-(pentapeptide) pyrophosphoryl-undecaprenol N-acetylglucosamine transferase
MKVFLAGGGTGGHFYPLIAVAQSLKDIAERERIVNIDITFVSDAPYDEDLLREEGIKFLKVEAGKVRRYFSILNFFDLFKTGWGILRALWRIYLNFPDVIFSKGGYASFPVLVAAKIFKIPLVIHDSDAVPGRVSLWSSRFARRVAISFPQALRYFPSEKVAFTGNPIRREVLGGSEEEANQFFGLEAGLPTILVLSGSQGAEKINDIILDIIPELVKNVQVIHQCGTRNIEEVKGRSKLVLDGSEFAKRYHPYGFLDVGAYRDASKVANLVISRAGAGHIFEMAAWGHPGILVPLPQAAQDHQRENAYTYAREGAAVVIEEQNLTPNILLSEITSLMNDEERKKQMRKAAQVFAKIDAGDKIAEEIIKLGLEHA